ncbi:NPC intracellular cholesterol transporter 2-like [Culicoides brevitarsis]|uniref:NPC intracellular cholesterol transporter 2-like n=1 Tax=Culicoides brevitarsis TaxID=469753 RepID=UPI00307C5B01
MFKILFVTLVALPAIFAIKDFTKCKGNGGGELPEYVNIQGCDEAPCHFYEGEMLNADAGLTVPHGTKSMKVKLDAYKLGIRIPFDLPEEILDACQFIEGATCPLKGGESIKYNLSTELEGIPHDNVKVQIEFALTDDTGKNMNCVRFDAIVHNPKTARAHKYSEVPRAAVMA